MDLHPHSLERTAPSRDRKCINASPGAEEMLGGAPVGTIAPEANATMPSEGIAARPCFDSCLWPQSEKKDLRAV